VIYNVTAQLEAGQPDTDLHNSSNHNISISNTFNTVNTAQFDEPSVIAKMTEFHEQIDSLHYMKCEDKFPKKIFEIPVKVLMLGWWCFCTHIKHTVVFDNYYGT